MTKGKQLNAFEVAQEIEQGEYARKKRIFEEARRSYESHDDFKYDSGLSEIEDRNEIHIIDQELEDLETEHIEKLKSLHIPTKDSR